MSETRITLRLPEGVCEKIKDRAASNNRSMNAEIIACLEGSERTLRDWFAGRASEKDISEHSQFWDHQNFCQTRSREAARYAYADAMLAARATLKEIGEDHG